ncbi:MAG: Flp family type IVb pilin [Phycisphaeraceae bacterium]|nr:Flp family type IVb pilin [Phycisphaeraceae bacterium]
MLDLLKRFVKDDSGISSVEYALLLAFVGSAVAASALALGNAVAGEMDEAATEIGTAVP